MAHQQQVQFCLRVKATHPSKFKGEVLDIGSLDINGNNRYLFPGCKYTGVDLAAGKNVDVVSRGHEFKPDKQYDVVISTECFEHDKMWKETIQNCFNLTKPGGLFIFTCATLGREEHGTKRSCPECSPFTGEEWGEDYYRNLTADDVKNVLPLEDFTECMFAVNNTSHDLYFYGIKEDL